ncbi:hypothetical protein BST61_g2886 [Cercospora zeina]
MEPPGARLSSWKRACYLLSALLLAQCFFLYKSIARSDSSADKWDTPAPVHQTIPLDDAAPSPATLPHLGWQNGASPVEQHFDNGAPFDT